MFSVRSFSRAFPFRLLGAFTRSDGRSVTELCSLIRKEIIHRFRRCFLFLPSATAVFDDEAIQETDHRELTSRIPAIPMQRRKPAMNSCSARWC